jgi:dynein heavy chain 1, cytosolic
MMVGPSGSGKSTAWRVLLKALELHEGIEGVAHVIDPKAMTKEALYGVLVPMLYKTFFYFVTDSFGLD